MPPTPPRQPRTPRARRSAHAQPTGTTGGRGAPRETSTEPDAERETELDPELAQELEPEADDAADHPELLAEGLEVSGTDPRALTLAGGRGVWVGSEPEFPPEARELGGAVSASEPLKRYMAELKQYPLLEPEEELRLARELHSSGSLQAAKQLAQANLRLVVKIAFEYRNIYSNLMDLIQEGNIGLMKAVSKYDPTKGARLGYYASWWIRSYILKYLLDNFRLVKIGTTQAQKKLFYHLIREKERLEAQGLAAGPKLLADRLHVREKDVLEMQQRLSSQGSELPLDAPVDPGAERRTSHLDLLVDDQEAADERVEREQLIEILQTRLGELEPELNARERVILRERLLADEPKTLQEVADQYGLTRERVRQIESGILTKLRAKLSELLSDPSE